MSAADQKFALERGAVNGDFTQIAGGAETRGGDWHKFTLTSAAAESEAQASDNQEIVGLDEALKALGVFDARQGHMVELRHVGALSLEESATAMNRPPAPVIREWALAKIFLKRAMEASA